MTTETNTPTKLGTERIALFQTSEDLKTALLAVSITINLFLFTTWLVIETDPSLSLMLVHTS